MSTNSSGTTGFRTSYKWTFRPCVPPVRMPWSGCAKGHAGNDRKRLKDVRDGLAVTHCGFPRVTQTVRG